MEPSSSGQPRCQIWDLQKNPPIRHPLTEIVFASTSFSVEPNVRPMSGTKIVPDHVLRPLGRYSRKKAVPISLGVPPSRASA